MSSRLRPLSIVFSFAAAWLLLAGCPSSNDEATEAADASPDQTEEALDSSSEAPIEPTDATVDATLDGTADADAHAHVDADADADSAPDASCGPDAAACGTACVDLSTDPHRCGACGHDCATLPGVRADAVHCLAGACDTTGACVSGRAHCTTVPDDGCETDVTTPAHCGNCTTVCPARANATPSCTGTGCSYQCNSGFSDCDGQAANGCEIGITNDATHCGSCGHRCNAGETCNGSACRCGTGRGCASGQVCSSGLCCPAGQKNCGGVCKTCCPNCTNRHCGDDGCGGSCGTCDACSTCSTGFGSCIPDGSSNGRVCGAGGAGRCCAGGGCLSPCLPSGTACTVGICSATHCATCCNGNTVGSSGFVCK